MSDVYLGLGSNLGNRRENLEHALRKIRPFFGDFNLSSLFESPALLPVEAPSDWNRPFLNLVVYGKTDELPASLYQKMLKIEEESGRTRGERWSPRVIDLDLLMYDGFTSSDPNLLLPHPRIQERAFVLGPLSEWNPSMIKLYKKHPRYQPRLMGILNITPDSFSDGGVHSCDARLQSTLDSWDQASIPIIDIGAESTRPGSVEVDEAEEWRRLEPALHSVKERYQNQFIKPKISVDTRHAATAERALGKGIDFLNDVNGLRDPRMVDLLREHTCSIVLMHNLAIAENPVDSVHYWMQDKIEFLQKRGIDRSRIILDPGIGFGKNALQSLQLIQGIKNFQDLGCLVLCGHSRKSFLRSFSNEVPRDRDVETLGVSFALRSNGVDILRVHDPVLHHRAFLSMEHAL